MKGQRSTRRTRSWLVIMIPVTIMATYISYNIIQGTMDISHLIPVSPFSEDPESIYGIDSYLVWSPKCQIPNINPFHESIRKFVVKAKPIVCAKKSPLSFTVTTPEGKIFLNINSSAIPEYKEDPKHVSCCYSTIFRINTPSEKVYNKTADNYYEVSECIYFSSVELSSEEEYVFVECNNTQKKTIYKNTHAVVQVKDSVRDKMERVQLESNERLSILIVGLDSTSRLNLLRTMPKTVGYLHRTGWLELQGYNKEGENTLPNLTALLMGLNIKLLKRACWTSQHKKFDDCPLIWRNFSDLGYVTAYLEDTPTQSTFNYDKTGFVKPPTDYYIRPMMLASEDMLPLQIRKYLAVCLGPTPTTDHMLKYVHDFAAVFNSALYFMIAWINNFSHSDTAFPSDTDAIFLKFFENLETTGALNTSLIIFLSDHGVRWGPIRKTNVGWLEERLPYIYFWVPLWFRKKYPDLYKNLSNNKNRLTSPFDVHVTLKDILHRSKIRDTSRFEQGTPACPKCASLFTEIPADRSCSEAGVTPTWCTCNKYNIIPTQGDLVKSIAHFVVSEINSKIKKLSNDSHVCSDLKFKQIIQVKRNADSKNEDYIVVIDTFPGEAVFEATVRRTKSKPPLKDIFQLHGDVSRITSYGNKTECVDSAELKLYCHCA